MQMSEFLEYIRQLHYKLTGGPKHLKKTRHPDEQLDNDSISEITDIEEDGILVTSMHKLDPDDQKRLNLYVEQMRALQKYQPPKHDCISAKKQKVNNQPSRFLMEMELKVKQIKRYASDKQCSAH